MRKILNIFLVILVILCVAGAGAYGYFRHFLYGKANYQDSTDGYTISTDVDEDSQSTVDDETAQKQREALSQIEATLPEETGTYNILLIGVDRRDASWNGNSDVMILLTINYDRETIYLTSFMRDLYADIPGVGVRKLNAACAYGGAALCVETIRSNYGVEIDNYAMVDFNGMINIVDAIGGIDLEVTDDEVSVVNGYITDMANQNQEDPSGHLFTSSGLVHLDGYMATAYARNRYSGGTNDFGRTERQRKVLEAIFEKVKDSGIGAITSLISEVLPYVTHDVKQSTIFSLITKMPSLSNYTVEQVRVPFDDSYTISNEILIPTDIGDTINRIRTTIY